jgi:WD40 repeat protein
MVDVRFPVADANVGRLWTLRLEQVDGRPGLWPHPDEVDPTRTESGFDSALHTAWRWACRTGVGVEQMSVRWRVVRDGGAPQVSGRSVGAAAAVGLTYLLELPGCRRRVDRRSALSATVNDNGMLGSVSDLPTKLERSGRDWRRLIVSEEDEQTARNAIHDELPKIFVAKDVPEAAKLAAQPRLSARTAYTAVTAAVLVLALASWYFVNAATTAGRASQARARDTQALHLAALANKLAASDPATALRLARSAFQLDPASADTQAALIQLTQADPRIRAYLGADGDPGIMRLAGSSSGHVVVSADIGGTVRSWYPACRGCSPTVLSRGTKVGAIAVAPDNSLVAVARGDDIALTTPAGRQPSGWQRRILRAGAPIDTVAINANGSQVAAGAADGTVYVWTRRHLAPKQGAVEGAGPMSAAIFLPDGRLVTGTAVLPNQSTQDLSVWRTGRGRLLRTALRPPRPPTLILPGVRSLAVVGHDLVIGETYLELRPLNSLNTVRTIHVSDYVDALVALDSTHVLVGTTTSASISAPPIEGLSSTPPTSFLDVDIATGHSQEAAFSASLTCLTPAVAIGPGHALLTGTTSGVLVEWSPAQRPGSQVLRAVPDPLDRTGVIVSRQDGSVDAFNAASGRVTTLIAANRHGGATAVAANGNSILVGYTDGTILRLIRGHGTAPVRFLNLPEKVFSIAFDPTGRILAVGGSSGAVQLFDAASGKLLRTLPHPHLGNVYAIAFDPTGKLVASSDVKDTVLVQRVDGTGTRSTALLSVGLLAWLHDGTLIAGNGLGSLYMLRMPLPSNPTPIAHPNTDNILGGALDPAQRMILTASADQTAALFDIQANQKLGRFPTLDASRSGSFAAAAWAASFTPDGRYAVFGTTGGYLQTVTPDTTILTARACAMAPTAPSPASTISKPDLQAARSACR